MSLSGIGELAYMILMGWMRSLVNWFWRIVSGGSGGSLQWFLSRWKLWLVILLAGGLIIDWTMWLIRWRPYRVFFSRFGASKKSPMPVNEAWDMGVGYYEPETMLDAEPADWSDLTLSTLSEVDPNWAEGIVIDADSPPAAGAPPAGLTGQYAKTYFYTDAYEEPAEAYQNAENATGYWENDPADEPAESEWQALPYEEDAEPWVEPSPALPYADEEEPAARPGKKEYYDEEDDRQADQWVALSNYQQVDPKPEEEAQYGRATMWPGAFPNIEKLEAEGAQASGAESSHNYYADEAFSDDIENDPLFSTRHEPETPRRQSRVLRKLRKSDEDNSRRRSRQSKKEEHQTPAFQKTRPQRLVQAVSDLPEQNEPGGFRTVTGKPVKRQGLLRLASTDDEPIAGLPPMQIDNAFYPKAMPNNPDFSDDDGNY
jgi:hypothetical protein